MLTHEEVMLTHKEAVLIVSAGGVVTLGVLLKGKSLKPHQITNGLLTGLTVMVGGLVFFLRKEQITDATS